MLDGINASAISAFHDQTLACDGWAAGPLEVLDGLWQYIAANHRYNTLLWDEEDQARRQDVPATAIAANKRAIDRYNQQRNDAIEAMDEIILAQLSSVAPREDAWLNSETAGSMIDRLSITALKIHHMGLQMQRTDATQTHREACSSKRDRLLLQRADLQHCFDALVAGMRCGRCFYRIYRQFKMYNDPSLNPYLYGGGLTRGEVLHAGQR